MRAGQAVTIDTDVYGGKVEFHGHLVGFGAGSGSAFALLPAQNASGNWIKIVQRVPVRVLLDPQELKSHPLRIGLSARVNVDLRDSSSEQASGVVRNTAQPVQTSAGDDPEVELRIAHIIAENSGPNAGA
jgi:membrane fusion protein (multidrug efflux system)